jgi:hypothetical protein
MNAYLSHRYSQLFTLLIILGSLTVRAQEDIIARNAPVLSLDINKDKSEAVFTDGVGIFVVDVDAFTVKDSLFIPLPANSAISEVVYVNSNQSIILAKTIRPGFYMHSFLTYPLDSTYMINIHTKTIVSRFANNVQIATGSLASKFALISESWYTYEDKEGNTNFGVSSNDILLYPENTKHHLPKKVSTFCISSDNTKMALLYYQNDDTKAEQPYLLEIRSLPDFGVVSTQPIALKCEYTSLIPGSTYHTYCMGPKLYFDDKSTYLIVEKPERRLNELAYKNANFIQIFHCSTGKLMTNIPNLTVQEIGVRHKNYWAKDGNSIVEFDLESKVKKTEIWANLTPFSSLDLFKFINDSFVLVTGTKSYNEAFGEGSVTGLYKYSLKDNAAYSKITSTLPSDTFFNPDAAFIQNNAFKKGVVQQSHDKSILISSAENHLQIWQAEKRKKLYDFTFDSKTLSFLDQTGTRILLIEANEQTGWSDFNLKLLDLKTGITHNRSFTDIEYGDFSFSATSQCISKTIDDSTTSFICTDGWSKLWEINSRTLEIQLLKDFKEEAFDFTVIKNLYSPGNSDTIYLNTHSYTMDQNYNETKNKSSTLVAYSMHKKEEIRLPRIQNEHPIYQHNNSLIYQENGQISILNLKNGKSEEIKTPKDFKLHTVTTSNLELYLALTPKSVTDSSVIFILDIKTLQKKTECKLDYGQLFFDDKYGINYEHSGQLFTFYPTQLQNIAWNNDQNLFTQKDDISLTASGLLLYKNEWLLNLATLEIEDQFPSFLYSTLVSTAGKDELLQIENNSYKTDKEKPHFILKTYDIATQKIAWQSEKQPFEKGTWGMNKIVSSPNNKYAVVYENPIFSKATSCVLLNLDTKKLVHLQNKDGFGAVQFSKDEETVILGSMCFSTADGKKQKSTIPTYDTSILYDGQFVELKILDKGTTYYARQYVSTVSYLADIQLIVAGSKNGNVLFWDLNNKSPKKIIAVGSASVLRIFKNEDKLFLLMKNSEIKVVDLNTLSLDATIAFFEKGDEVSLVWYTPQGYFKADKSDIRNFHFVKDLASFPLINYEVLLNRPDTLMARLGFTDEALQRTYKMAYQRRLKRNGIESSDDFLSQHRPQLQLINGEEIHPIATSPHMTLEVKTITSNDNNTLINTYINGVKVASNGVTKQEVLSIPIILSSGENNISVIANENGVESEPISLAIYNNAVKRQPRIYYVGIGVSQYLDSSMNLRYADKDVRKMSAFLQDKYGETVLIDTLTNEEATKSNVLALKENLKSTSVDDIVILAFSGHGLLNAQQNFYFATHDIDFENPALNGLSYDDVAFLLDDIPARKKLLLIDACHSGEIDSEEDLRITKFTNKNVTESTPKGASVVESNSDKTGLNASLDLMKSLFYDTDRGNGAFVISAAGGKEFAYEDEKWGNGVFTYSIINAISKLNYDARKSGAQGVKISKLKKEVYNQVEELTDGMQKPTSRAENVEWDWEL